MKEDIIDLYAQGLSYNQIAAKLGCSKGTISYHLGYGQHEKVIERTKDRRNRICRFIQEYKQTRGCADCKENYPHWMLEFDHIGEKSFNISSFRSSTCSIDVIKAEVAKCEVVCSNCHKNRTYLRLRKNGGDIAESYYD